MTRSGVQFPSAPQSKITFRGPFRQARKGPLSRQESPQGGDEIGARPVDYHLAAFQALGAQVEIDGEGFSIRLDRSTAATEIRLPGTSAGASVNALGCSIAARREVEIEGVPWDSDMAAVVTLCASVGAPTLWTGRRLTVGAVPAGSSRPVVEVRCPPDRNDAATWLALSSITDHGIAVQGADPDEMQPFLGIVAQLGADVSVGQEGILVVPPPEGLIAPEHFVVVGGTSPDFHSDWLSFIQLVLVHTQGRSTTVDRLYSTRSGHALTLRRMGDELTVGGGEPPVGVEPPMFPVSVDQATYIVSLRGRPDRTLESTTIEPTNDVRGTAAGLLAVSVASGVGRLKTPAALYRGYDNMVGRLRALGANVAVDNPAAK